MTYAPPEHWDQYFNQLYQTGRDLDWQDQWTGAFSSPLRQAGCQTVLDLGCGTGNDVLRLTTQGFTVTGFDYSQTSIRQAKAKAGFKATFIVADMAKPLPFPDASFDAVMSNVAAHMFSDTITRSLFAEIRRIIRTKGLFLFHLNALEDRPLRTKRKPPAREIEPNYILEKSGQTMHFFSKDYLRDLLAGWHDINLALIEILDHKTGAPFKRVWRGIIQR